jgi:hypothetical protein
VPVSPLFSAAAVAIRIVPGRLGNDDVFQFQFREVLCGLVTHRKRNVALDAMTFSVIKEFLLSEVDRAPSAEWSVSHPVPTAITHHDGKFYVSTFGSASTNGAAVYEITPRGKKRTLITGLNPVVGITFREDKLYILETFSGDPYSSGTGRLLRLSRSGKIEKTRIIACGLTFPTSMTIGPDGAFYISNVGYGVDPTAGLGEVMRIPIDD